MGLGEVPLLSCSGLVKIYPGLVAINQVDFELNPGEVHVILGENGAGKSTLISLILGVIKQNAGVIYMRGAEIWPKSVRDARAYGIYAVFQELSLVPQMTVAENLTLCTERTRYGLLRRGLMRKLAREALARLGMEMDVGRTVDSLTRGEQQIIEICRAFRNELAVLILDEPTASISEQETRQLFLLLRAAKRRGVGIIYITHRLGEIGEIGDRVTVLRDGKVVTTVPAKTDTDELIRLMTGRQLGAIYPKIPHNAGEVLLRTVNLTTRTGSVKNASITVRRGEIVGLAGLVGCGKSELGRACYGLERIDRGEIVFNRETVGRPKPVEQIRRGLFYLPSDRKWEGLMLSRPVSDNVSLAALVFRTLVRWGFVKAKFETRLVGRLARRVDLPVDRLKRGVQELSGGNQQKVMVARSMAQPIDCFILDEPTVGIDIATRASIYRIIRDLVSQGAGVLLISSDLMEVMSLSHRLYVMRAGGVSAEIERDGINEAAVLSHFFDAGRAAA
jgi:ribose transport system ATP-binding protein